jgi:DNA polymerase-3 subunit beta
MKFTISRAVLLKPLQIISGVVERKQTLPILANVLITAKDNKLQLTGTDLEIELIGSVPLEQLTSEGAITVAAKKLFDICRALPDEAELNFSLEKEQLLLRSGKSRYSLAVRPAEEFPKIENGIFFTELTLSQSKLRNLISKVYFAMGQQDVRHYLNGALLDIDQDIIKCVATDGHRLAYSAIDNENMNQKKTRIILPRKSILELMRLLESNNDEMAKICIGDNHFRLISSEFIFTSKLINAQYPDYNKLIPRSITNVAVASREGLKQALTRASILSSEKFRGIKLQFEQEVLKIVANNPDQEEAEELIGLEYQGASVEMGFNVAYLLDVMSSITGDNIQCSFTDPHAGVLIEAFAKTDNTLYVVMPMRL